MARTTLPGPKSGGILPFRSPFVHDRTGFLLRAAREYGDVVAFRVGSRRLVLVTHPDAIRDVLVTKNANFVKSRGLERMRRLLGNGLLTSEDPLHARQRRLVAPAFHRERLLAYGTVMVECARATGERWQDGATVDMAREMSRLTLAIVGRTLFAADVADEADDIGAALTELMRVFDFTLLPGSELFDHLPIPATIRFRRARARLDATIYRLMAQRRQDGQDRGDLLSMLLGARDEEGGAPMDDAQVRDEAITLFLAGHETTANALTWTWYSLSEHPAVQAALQAELDAQLGGRLPTFTDLPKLGYAAMVLAEAMRLYPPAWVIGRRALADCQIGGYGIPANTVILVSPYVTHRDPRWYPNPLRFDPLRWTAQAVARRPKFAYVPFGGGPRVCIGEQFARMEGVLVLAALAQAWRARRVPAHAADVEPLITLRPKGGMPMTLSLRSRANPIGADP